MTVPETAPPPVAPPPPAPPRGGRRRGWLLAAALMLPLVLAAGLAALVGSASGTRWLLEQLPGITVVEPQGALLSPDFAARELRVRGSASQDLARVQGLRWRGAEARLGGGDGAWFQLRIARLTADRIDIDTGPSSDERLTPPRSLSLPLMLLVDEIAIGELHVDRQPPVKGLAASARLGPQAHALTLSEAHWQDIALQGQARLAAQAPFALDLRLQAALQGTDGWDAQATALGPLASFDVKARLAGRGPTAGAGAPALDAQAQIRPFEAWPLGAVTAETRELDLSAILPQAPRTRLTGHAQLRSRGLREPLDLALSLDNASPGRIDDGALPILALRLALKADPRQPDRLVVGPFEIDAADARGSAGRWTGEGLWTEGTLSLSTRLTDLQPARLDGRLATMRLSGPLTLNLQGLPHPDPRRSAPWVGWRALGAAVQAELSGHVSGAPEDVALVLDARGDAQGLDIRRFQASSGPAKLEGTARLARAEGARWRLATRGELAAFDPTTWFPGAPTAVLGRGPHRFNGHWSFDLDMPEQLVGGQWAQWLPRLRGQADLHIADSRLAGLPFAADLQLRQDEAQAAGPRSRAKAEARLGSATVSMEGSGDPLADGQADRTQLRLSAPSLAELTPLVQPWPGLQDWVPRQGEVQLSADLRGRWPALSAELQASGKAVRVGALSLQAAQLTARLDRAHGDELALNLNLSGLGWSGGQLDAAHADLRGSLANHRFDAELSAPLSPPPALAQALAWRIGNGAVARLQGSGSFNGNPAQGGRWTGQIERLGAGARDSAAAPGQDGSWFEVRGVQAEWSWLASDGIARAALQPGRAQSGALAFRWQELQWQGNPDGPDQWRVAGELEPLAVAPLLQRAQHALPGTLQWGGDLKLGARVDIRAASRLEADVRLFRDGGDLSFSDGTPPQPLGLSQIDVQLTARDGVWRFSPRLQGRMLGRLDGDLLARAQPAERWPSPKAPLEGRLQAQVASLAAWSGWLPPGWRMQGALDLQAQLSGTVGAPGYTGFVKGQQIGVRNLLQGVDLQDGELAVRLEGETARIETLQIRGGEGRLSAEGQARFGAQPSLQLAARADKLRVLGRVDRQLVLSGSTTLAAASDRLRIDGRIAADSGLFDLSSRDAPGLDEDVDVRRPGAPVAAEVARREPSPMLRQTQMALDVDLGSHLRLRGRGLDTGLAGTLRLSAPGGRLSIQGTVRAEGGTYAAYGQKLEIERGDVSFAGAPDRARLDILALRPNLDIRAGVLITGPALDPRVRLYSEPDMAETDKLAWLVLGRGPEGLGRTDTALLQRAAVALLAGEGGGPTDAVMRMLGIDDFSIRKSDGDVKETIVSVGKQLSRRWYVGYERGVNATSGTWQLIYRAAQRFTLRAQSGEDNSLDLIWTWRFGGPPRRTD